MLCMIWRWTGRLTLSILPAMVTFEPGRMHSHKQRYRGGSIAHRSRAKRSSSTAWVLVLVGLVVLIVGGLMGPFSRVYGQRGAEPGAVVMENDRVVVRRYLLQPGISTGMHSHSRDYLRVVLQGGTVEITTLQGPTRTEKLEAGSMAWRTKATHDSKNIGGNPIEVLVIEIK